MTLIPWHIINKYSNSTPIKTIFWTLHPNEGSSLELSEVQHPDSNGGEVARVACIAIIMNKLAPKKLSSWERLKLGSPYPSLRLAKARAAPPAPRRAAVEPVSGTIDNDAGAIGIPKLFSFGMALSTTNPASKTVFWLGRAEDDWGPRRYSKKS